MQKLRRKNKLAVLLIIAIVNITLTACNTTETNNSDSNINDSIDKKKQIQVQEVETKISEVPVYKPNIIYDDADILTNEEETELNIYAEKYRENTDVGIILITTIELQYAESLDSFIKTYTAQHRVLEGGYDSVILYLYDAVSMAGVCYVYDDPKSNDHSPGIENMRELADMYFNDYLYYKGFHAFIEGVYDVVFFPDTSSPNFYLTNEEKYENDMISEKYSNYSEDYYKNEILVSGVLPYSKDEVEAVLSEKFYGIWKNKNLEEVIEITKSKFDSRSYGVICAIEFGGLYVYWYYLDDPSTIHVWTEVFVGGFYTETDESYLPIEDYDEYMALYGPNTNSTSDSESSNTDINGEELEAGDKVTYQILFFTPEEANEFLDSVKNTKYYPLYSLELVTGLRLGEIVALRWESVDLEKMIINIKQTAAIVSKEEQKEIGVIHSEVILQTPKTKKSIRTLFIEEPIVSMLRKLRKEQLERKMECGEAFNNSGFVFTNDFGNMMHPRSIQEHFKRVIKNQGFPNLHFHCLRHTAASIMLYNGVDIKTVQEILGHEDIQTTLDIYTHIFSEMKREGQKTICNVLTIREGCSYSA